MKSKGILLSISALALAVITACGGGDHHTPGGGILPGPSAKASVKVSSVPGASVYGSTATVAKSYGFSPVQILGMHFMLFQVQTTVSLNQSFNGLCAQVNANTVNFLPGLGGISSTENCSQTFRNFVNPGEGAPIIGDGTIGGTVTPVIVTGSISGGDANSGKIELFENPSTTGAPIPTGIVVTLGTAKRVIINDHPFTIHDGNYLVAKLTSGNGQINSLNVVVLKQ
jgi:hypothetical protein